MSGVFSSGATSKRFAPAFQRKARSMYSAWPPRSGRTAEGQRTLCRLVVTCATRASARRCGASGTIGRHQPTARCLVGHRRLRRLPALRCARATAIGIGRIAAQLDVDHHRQPRLHRGGAIGQAVHQPRLHRMRCSGRAAGPCGWRRPPVRRRHRGSQASAHRTAGADIWRYRRRPACRAAGGGEARAQRLGDGAPGGRAHQGLVGGDAVATRRFAGPVRKTCAGLFRGLQDGGRRDE